MGMRVVAEAFADRRYEADGMLRSRAHADAMIKGPEEAAEQAASIVRGRVTVGDGREVGVVAETICIHGDTPRAVEIARAVRMKLDREGIKVRPLG